MPFVKPRYRSNLRSISAMPWETLVPYFKAILVFFFGIANFFVTMQTVIRVTPIFKDCLLILVSAGNYCISHIRHGLSHGHRTGTCRHGGFPVAGQTGTPTRTYRSHGGRWVQSPTEPQLVIIFLYPAFNHFPRKCRGFDQFQSGSTGQAGFGRTVCRHTQRNLGTATGAVHYDVINVGHFGSHLGLTGGIFFPSHFCHQHTLPTGT